MYASSLSFYNVLDPGALVGSDGGARAGCGCASGLGGCGCTGLGLFATPFDLKSWTWQEYGVAAAAVFVLFSVFSTSARGVRSVRRKARYIAGAGQRRRSAKAAALRSEAAKLEARS